MKRARWPDAAIALLLFLLNFGLNTPLFMRGDSPYRDSIEPGYASMARFVAQNPDPWGWNPLQYCGVPTQFMYLPGLPYAAALIARLSGTPPEYIYRLIASTMACLGPAVLFLFVRWFTRGRWWALAAALAYTFFSPLYGMVRQIDQDRTVIAQLPWRLQVLAKYGEGPHNAGLTLLPLALMAVWAAGTARRYERVFFAAVLLAAIALTNWVAALAAGIACLALLASAWDEQDFSSARVVGAAALAYLLACFWLTPAFIGTIAGNWPTDSFAYRAHWPQVISAAGLLLALGLAWAALRRRGPYFLFVNLACLLFGWIALGHYWFGVSLIPESRRYALEFELFLIVALVEWLRLAWEWKRPVGAVLALLVILPGLPQAWKYSTGPRHPRTPWPLQETPEYPLAEWLSRQPMAGRVFATGGLRYRLDAWFAIPQVGGGFESGLRNRRPVDLFYQVRTGSAGLGRGFQDQLTQLKALAVEYLVVHGPNSREYYRDFANPRQFEGRLPVAFHREDDTIYRLPVTSLAHLVHPEELPAWHKPPHLDRYAAALDDPARPKLALRWQGASRLSIEGAIPEGMLVSVQVNADPGWRALQDGRSVPMGQDSLGFLVLRPRPAPHTRIQLVYGGTLEQRLMAGISAVAWLAALTGLWRARRRRAPERVEILQ